MTSKSDAGSESSPDFDESWILVDEMDMPENDGELDESVLNPVSSRARSVSNLVQKMRGLKPKRSANPSNRAEGGSQADTRGGAFSTFRRLRSRSSTFADDGEKRQGTKGER